MYRIQRIKEIDSTNSELKRLALLGAPTGTVLIADRQTAGRGRLGRAFFSPAESGLYMSILIRPVSLDNVGLITTFTAVAVARALEKHGASPFVKWVNDLVLDGKKVCGILVEGGVYEGQPFAVVGIGVNVKKTAFPEELSPIAVSLEQVLGKAPSPQSLAEDILAELAAIDPRCPRDPKGLMEEYRRRSCTLGRPVRVQPFDGQAYDAVATAIEDDGALTVLTDDGRSLRVFSGEVSVRPI